MNGSPSSSFSEEVLTPIPQDEELAAEDLTASEEVAAPKPQDEELAAHYPTASDESGTSSSGDERDIHEPNLRVEEIIAAHDESSVKSPETPGNVEYGCTFDVKVHPLQALGDRVGPRRSRDAGPLYGGRCRWSPYPTKRRHYLVAKCTRNDLLIDDTITEAAPELESAPEADEAREVSADAPLIDEVTANAALEQERALEADDANEVPVEEQLALHIAAGKAKVSAWWKALADARDARAAAAFTFGHQESSAVEDTYYALFNAPMPDDLDEDSEMSGMEDAWLLPPLHTPG